AKSVRRPDRVLVLVADRGLDRSQHLRSGRPQGGDGDARRIFARPASRALRRPPPPLGALPLPPRGKSLSPGRQDAHRAVASPRRGARLAPCALRRRPLCAAVPLDSGPTPLDFGTRVHGWVTCPSLLIPDRGSM